MVWQSVIIYLTEEEHTLLIAETEAHNTYLTEIWAAGTSNPPPVLTANEIATTYLVRQLRTISEQRDAINTSIIRRKALQ